MLLLTSSLGNRARGIIPTSQMGKLRLRDLPKITQPVRGTDFLAPDLSVPLHHIAALIHLQERVVTWPGITYTSPTEMSVPPSIPLGHVGKKTILLEEPPC